MIATEINYYKILGVSRNTPTSDIKQKYRALSKLHHPDTSGGSVKLMAQINEAYSVLSDPVKRLNYQPPVPAEPTSKKRPYSPTQTANPPQKQSQSPQKNSRHYAQKPIKPRKNWGFVFWFVLATPFAIAVLMFGAPFYNMLQTKADTAVAGSSTTPIIPDVTSDTRSIAETPKANTQTSSDADIQTQSQDSSQPDNVAADKVVNSANTTTNPTQSNGNQNNQVDNSTPVDGLQNIIVNSANSNRHYRSTN